MSHTQQGTERARPLSSEAREPGGDRRWSRRGVLSALAGIGVGSAAFQRALAAQADEARAVTAEMVEQAAWIAGIELDEEERERVARDLQRAIGDFEAMRNVALENAVPPAIVFHPAPWLPPAAGGERGRVVPSETVPPERPTGENELAFLPATELAALVRTRQVSSVELTKLYLERLERHDPLLKCVVTLLPEVALEQAKHADREIAAGRYRGPLHGLPWGAKDLIAYPGHPTTWGAPVYRDQTIATKATVARRLDDAGAVLAAKLSLGALAMGDRWFGGMTRNPWNPEQGSSGSSAGSAAATAAGLVAFSIGSETLGSIVSPSRRCGTTGLRPTFGRVSRHGCMTLSWSMDKLGPICRSVEDCALVFGAIHGFDGFDPAAVDRPFDWPPRRDLRTFRVGYVEDEGPVEDREELRVLQDLGVKLVPITLPEDYPANALDLILDTEAAAVFDELTRQGVTEGLNSWPHTFRKGQFIPAVEYLRANRIRTLLMRAMDELMSTIDCYVGGDDLVIANLTGHPTVCVPSGLRKQDEIETPTAITFTGRLYGETDLLSVAHAWQRATGHHLRHPVLAAAPVEAEKP